MPYVIRYGGSAGSIVFADPTVRKGDYLRSYDPDAFGGRGDCEWTHDPAQAMKFAQAGDAFAEWKRISRVRPVREDGKPNRPLTAVTIMVDDLNNRGFVP